MGLQDIEEEFLHEISDICEETEALLLSLERDGFEAECFNKIMRNLHNLKGTCGVLELDTLSRVMHNMETYLLDHKNDVKQAIDNMLKALSKIYDYLHHGEVSILQEIILAATPSNEQNEQENQEKQIDQKLLKPQFPKNAEVAVPQIKRTSQEAFYKNDVTINDLKVYHIDDEPLILEIVKGDLESWGLEVYTFEDLKSLRQAVLDGGLPDLFLIDNKLKETTGIEILKNLNKLVPSIPKIIFSGYVDQELMFKALQNGAFGIIEKPFMPELFKENLKLIKKRKIRDVYLKESHKFQMHIYQSLLSGKIDQAELLGELESLLEKAEGVGFKKSH